MANLEYSKLFLFYPTYLVTIFTKPTVTFLGLPGAQWSIGMRGDGQESRMTPRRCAPEELAFFQGIPKPGHD
jgi:hypothetical protein